MVTQGAGRAFLAAPYCHRHHVVRLWLADKGSIPRCRLIEWEPFGLLVVGLIRGTALFVHADLNFYLARLFSFFPWSTFGVAIDHPSKRTINLHRVREECHLESRRPICTFINQLTFTNEILSRYGFEVQFHSIFSMARIIDRKKISRRTKGALV